MNPNIADTYSDIYNIDRPWSEPLIFDLSQPDEQIRLEDTLKLNGIARIHDPIKSVAQALCEYYHPETKGNPDLQTDYVQETISQGEAFGSWVYFPWSQSLIRYPNREDYHKLRTSRNRELISAEEQDSLLQKKIAVLGLSVGSKALSSLVEAGIGSHYVIADPDYIDPTNLNRIDAGFPDVGTSKIDLAAKKISEKDPWIKQVHLRNGINTENSDKLSDVDIIVEEVDDLSIKALVRLVADREGIPLLMAADIADKSVVDVERYDLHDRGRIMFNGRISAKEAAQMACGKMTESENKKYMLKHTGIRHLTARMMRSAMAVGDKIGGLPQLGSTATRGGADITFAAREILLGHELPSGRYVDSARRLYGLSASDASIPDTVGAAVSLLTYARQMK